MWLRVSVTKPRILAAEHMEVRVLISTDPPSSLSPAARRSEIAIILAAGIVRLKSRTAIVAPEQSEDSLELPTACLEVSSKSVLSVTNVVND